MKRWRLSIIITFILSSSISLAQPPHIGISFYDVDRLYDTIPSLFYNDRDFTPEGRHHWNSERYNTKIQNITQVIDSMALPLVALYGVESEAVVHDIVSRSQLDYSYIHRTINSLDGLDIALLYYGDRFYPTHVISQRYLLHIDGEMDSEPLSLTITKRGDDLCRLESLLREEGNNIVIGSFNDNQIEGLNLNSTFSNSIGIGNYYSERGWQLRHRAATSSDFETVQQGIYIKSWLLDSNTKRPKATISKEGHSAGYSLFLPIYLYLKRQ